MLCNAEETMLPSGRLLCRKWFVRKQSVAISTVDLVLETLTLCRYLFSLKSLAIFSKHQYGCIIQKGWIASSKLILWLCQSHHSQYSGGPLKYDNLHRVPDWSHLGSSWPDRYNMSDKRC